MDSSSGVVSFTQRILLSCGLIAALAHLGMDWLAGRLAKGYDLAARSMSDLGALGSPTRALVVVLTLVASALMIAFGVGVWRAGQAPLQRVVGGLVIANAAVSLVATLFFPNRYGERPAFGSPGVILMFLSVVFFVLAMIVGAVAFRGWLRGVSIAIPAAYVLLAALRFATAPPAGDSAALIGAQERTMAYSYLFWVMALAIHLLLGVRDGTPSGGPGA